MPTQRTSSAAITEKSINKVYEDIIADVSTKVDLIFWMVQPLGIQVEEDMDVFGRTTSRGMLEILKNFIGTQAHSKLRNTITYELARQCVGFKLRDRGKRLRVIADWFGYDPVEMHHQEEMVTSTIHYKWSVIALLNNGRTHEVAKVKRKAKKWTQYAITDGTDIEEGQEVLSYIYKENKKNDSV